MKKAPSYIVYSPPMDGFPYLAVILATDGTATARPFETAQAAAAHNKLMAEAGHPGKIKH